MAQVMDNPDAPQGLVIRYEFAFYGGNYEQVEIKEFFGPVSLKEEGTLINKDRILFCLTYWARMIHNLGKHHSATQLIRLVRDKGNAAQDVVENCDELFSSRQFGYETNNYDGKPRKQWSATMTREKGGGLTCKPKVTLFGDVHAMSISSTLTVLNRTMRLATPVWRDMLLVGLGAMIHFYETYDHSKVAFISAAPSAGWDAMQLAAKAVVERDG